MSRARAILAIVVLAPALGATLSSAHAASAVSGRMASDGVTGRTVIGHGWREEPVFLSPQVPGVGAATRTAYSPPGDYTITGGFPAGEHHLFTMAFDRCPAFSYRLLDLPSGSGTVSNIELRTPAHYSVAYNQNFTEWGSEPWIWGSSMYQTFVATSPHVTRLATKLAGKAGSYLTLNLNFAVYATNAGPPSTWPQVSPTRSYFIAGSVDSIIHIFWVAYRSSEVNLVVGQKYAVRIWVGPGSQADSFAVVARPDNGVNGYADGHLYVGDTPHTHLDGFFYVSGGSPDTVVNHAPVTDFQYVGLAGWQTRFGQTFRATGASLAGVETVYTTGSADPVLHNITFQVYDGVGGNPVGPPRNATGLPAFHYARVAAAWRKGEVPLVPGQMYYLEYTTPASGCNTWYISENLPGELYVNRVSQGTRDLAMSIAEYRLIGPTIALNKSTIVRSTNIGGSPSPDVFTLRNSGSGTVNYTVSSNVGWLAASPATGSTVGDQEETITLHYATGGLALGTHTATLAVSDSGAVNSPQTIGVAVTIRPHPGDMDLDRDVDMEDFGLFQRCLTGAGIPQTDSACARALLDGDDDVDMDDTEVFIRCLSGPGIFATPGCGD